MNSSEHHRFLRLVTSSTEGPSPLTHRTAPLAQDILNRIRDALAITTSVGFTSFFFDLVRATMLPRQSKWEGGAADQLRMFSKIEVAVGRPLEWLYAELKLPNNQEPQSPIRRNTVSTDPTRNLHAAFTLSCSLIFELNESSHFHSFQQSLSAFRQASGPLQNDLMPIIFFLYSPETFSSAQLQAKLKELAIQYVLIEKWQTEGEELVQQQKRNECLKRISQSLTPKIIARTPLTPKLLLLFAEHYLSEEDTTIDDVWTKITQIDAEDKLKVAVADYQEKLREITEGSQILPIQFLKQAEAKVRGQVLKRAHQLVEPSPLMQTLDSLRIELEQRNLTAIFNWGKDLLRETYATIERKLGKDIKSLSAYRQQILILIEFLRKRSEQFLTIELCLYIQQFLIGKIFEGTQTIHSQHSSQLLEQSRTVEAGQASLVSQNKQLRRKIAKEEHEIVRQNNELKHKVSLLETKCSILEEDNEQLRSELIQTQQKQDEAIHMSERRSSEANKLVADEIEKIRQERSKWTQRLQLLQSQLSKEKLLHEQSHSHYREQLRDYRQREQSLQEELEMQSLHSSRQLDLLRESSIRENHGQLTVQQAQQARQIQLSNALTQSQQEAATIKQDLQYLRTISKAKQDQLHSRISEIQIRNRLLEEREVECQLLKNKLRRSEQQTKRLTKQREQQLQQVQQAQKQKLVAQQKSIYLEQTLTEQKTKIRDIIHERQTLRNQRDALQHQMDIRSKRILIDEWVQVEDTLQKQKLRAALELIKQLEGEYNRLRAEQQWAKRTGLPRQ